MAAWSVPSRDKMSNGERDVGEEKEYEDFKTKRSFIENTTPEELEM